MKVRVVSHFCIAKTQYNFIIFLAESKGIIRNDQTNSDFCQIMTKYTAGAFPLRRRDAHFFIQRLPRYHNRRSCPTDKSGGYFFYCISIQPTKVSTLANRPSSKPRSFSHSLA